MSTPPRRVVLARQSSMSERQLLDIFDAIDVDKSGTLSIDELEKGASHLFVAGASLPAHKVRGRIQRDTAMAFLQQADTVGNGYVTREQWVQAIRQQEKLLWTAFMTAGKRPTAASLDEAFRPYFPDPMQREQFVAQAVDAFGDGEPLTFPHFQAWVKEYRLQTLQVDLEAFRTLDTGHDAQVSRSSKGGSVGDSLRIFGAGLLAGAASRTATAPGERLKVMRATGQLNGPLSTWWPTLRAVVAKEGVATFWRGNVANVLKVAPAKGVKFLLFESFVRAVARVPDRPTTAESLLVSCTVAGAAAAITHPLDTLKTMLAAGAEPPTMLPLMRRIVAEQGVGCAAVSRSTASRSIRLGPCHRLAPMAHAPTPMWPTRRLPRSGSLPVPDTTSVVRPSTRVVSAAASLLAWAPLLSRMCPSSACRGPPSLPASAITTRCTAGHR